MYQILSQQVEKKFITNWKTIRKKENLTTFCDSYE